ncbi:P1 family peptidase [Denitrobaculum tricleocarpae]|uniref:P1 family peptidase n=1 Tax=Denitrobaculum tricleocarpae TaxID=2591009 RepID=A0A545TM98_9PROT|nr:P1 family peptidase [Denitrobaculum tricleocarpae]TQV78306.1 P1 family peptidase [Denitrobaculum tricleocarpae]
MVKSREAGPGPVGPSNAITDVPGLKVGNAGDFGLRSGVTVILPDRPAVAAVDARGGGTGTRETVLLDPSATVERVDAIVLSGGSAFGLDAASGVTGWLAEQGRGFRIKEAVVPIVPAAILFDLQNGGDKDWGRMAPYHQLGKDAAAVASIDFALGNAGAGIGAAAGDLKGGLGSASVLMGTGVTVGALAAVNPVGSVVMPGTAHFWAWPFERDGEFGGSPPSPKPLTWDQNYSFPQGTAGQNTTLVAVATDAVLTKAQAQRVAVMAQDGLARAIRPVHTPLDGDVVFVLSTGRIALKDSISELATIGMLAADTVARAIARGVYEAESLGETLSYRERFSK